MIDAALGGLAAVRALTLRTVAPLTQQQLEFSPRAGRWSIGEVLDHILLAEAAYRAEISLLIDLKRGGQRPHIARSFADMNGAPFHLPDLVMSWLAVPLGIMNQFIPDALRDLAVEYAIVPVRNPDQATPRPRRPGADLRAELVSSPEAMRALIASNADLDFHTDSADAVMLTCYNVARSGGMSMVTSSVAAHNAMARERPDLAELLHQPYFFSRQAEQAPHEAPYYPNPIFDQASGVLCSKWNRNRLRSAQAIDGVPQLTALQHEAVDMLDEILRRPDLMYSMYLRPGDMQILNNHVTLHSRTEFVDHDEPELKRTLFRLWLAPPQWPTLPESWRPAYGAVEADTVRGGILGQAYDETRRAYEVRQAADLGMRA